MRKKRIIIIACILLTILSITFMSKYYTNTIYKIIASSFYSNGTDYKSFSKFISEEDYKKINPSPHNDYKRLYINGDLINKNDTYNCGFLNFIVLLPHNFFTSTTHQIYVMVETEDKFEHIEEIYTCKIKFDGLDMYIDVVDSSTSSVA